MADNRFAMRLKELRHAAGLSQPELAGLAGMTKAGICDLEQGRNQPTWATVQSLAEALGVTPNDFRPVASKPTGKRPKKK